MATSTDTKDLIDLAGLYATGRFSDCVIVAANGKSFKAHRLVLATQPTFTELVENAAEPDRRVQLQESAEVVDCMLKWIYGLDWAGDLRAIGSAELVVVMEMSLAGTAYNTPTMAEDAYAVVEQAIGRIDSIQDGLRIMKDLAIEGTVNGALQRTILNRTLALRAEEESSEPGSSHPAVETHQSASSTHAVKKRARPEDAHTLAADTNDNEADMEFETDTPAAANVPKRSKRSKKLTEKAKEPSLPRKRVSKGKEDVKPVLHCVCRVPEDRYLVQCESCDKWFHPGCVGKGKQALVAYERKSESARKKDEKYYREQNIRFSCEACDEDA